MYYFASHRYLWPLFRARLLPIILLSIFIYTLLFFFAYLPQVAFLALFQGSGAWFSGLVLVLGEGSAIVAGLFEAFFVDETLVDIFDAIFISEGHAELVGTARLLNPEEDTGPAPDPVKRLGKPVTSAVYAPFSLRQIVEFVLLLPLNLVPVAGTPVFLVLTGYRAGPFHHWRYFRLLDLSKHERKAFVRGRQLQYTTYAPVVHQVRRLSTIFLVANRFSAGLEPLLWSSSWFPYCPCSSSCRLPLDPLCGRQKLSGSVAW